MKNAFVDCSVYMLLNMEWYILKSKAMLPYLGLAVELKPKNSN